ncbi:MAG: GAF domain-containing sensor histidine kinase [Chloroflexi bacterium]|nr:GAF domain-containing sensor histidine kinase [Chloroflexota bacterium]
MKTIARELNELSMSANRNSAQIARRLDLGVLTWVAIVVPVGFLAVLDVVRHVVFPGFLHTVPGFVVSHVVIAAGVAAFSFAVFGLVRRLERRIIDQNRQLSALNDIAKASAAKLNLQELLDTSLEEVLSDLRVDAGLICIVDAEKREHSAVCHRGFSREMISRLQRAKFRDTPVAAEVVRSGRPVIYERVLEDPRVIETARREGIRSGITAPLKAEGEVTGLLVVASRRDRRFSQAEREFLETVGGQLGVVIRNTVLYEKSQAQNRELAALLDAGRAITAATSLDDLLGKALDTLIKVTPADAGEIWLLDPDGVLVMRCHRGALPETFMERTRFQVGEGIPGLVMQDRVPFVTHDLGADARFLRQGVVRAGFRTFCAVPLLYRGTPVGVVAAAAFAAEAFSRPEDLRLLEGIAERLALAIENSRLQQAVQESAVLQERERIAREMHDGMGQLLGYVNTQLIAVRTLLSRRDTGAAMDELTKMEEVARDLYGDVREGILGLRMAGKRTDGFIPAVGEYVERYREMSGIDVRITVEREVEHLALTPAVEIQLMRIVQEALTNVRKHSGATAANVRFEPYQGGLRVTVSDNGRGFDVARPVTRGWPRFGLQTMRERAQSIDGVLDIETGPGRGTTVTVRIPGEGLGEG